VGLLKNKKYILVGLVLSLVFFSLAQAATYPTINYQGKLTNTSDSPVVDGDYNMRFRFCSDSDCNTVVWVPEVWCNGDNCLGIENDDTGSDFRIPVQNGLFSVMIGQRNAGLPRDIWDDDLYLEVAVAGTSSVVESGDWQVLLPRKRLGVVPAAFYSDFSSNSGLLNGKDDSYFAALSENETISGIWNFNNILSINTNSSSPAFSILQAGSGAGIEIGDGSVTTSIFSNATSTFSYGATFATNGGAVSIGTSSSFGMLTVDGDVNITGNYLVNGFSIALPSASNGQVLRYGDSGWEATSTLFIDSSGKIGVGTTTPTENLSIVGTSGFYGTSNFSGPSYFNSTSTFKSLVSIEGKVVNPEYINGIIGNTSTGFLVNPYKIFMQGKYAYVLDSGNGLSTTSLQILDFSDNNSIKALGILESNDDKNFRGADSMYVSGRYAYIYTEGAGCGGGGAVQIVDISNPNNPTAMGSLNCMQGVNSAFVAGNYLYIGVGGGLLIFDISNPNKPVEIGSFFQSGTDVKSILVSGRYAYLGDYGSKSFHVVDVSDPTNPSLVGSLNDGDGGVVIENPVSLAMSGNYVFLANSTSSSGTIEVIDVSEKNNPSHVVTIENGGQYSFYGILELKIYGKYLFAVSAAFPSKVTIIDIGNISNPVFVKDIDQDIHGMMYIRSAEISGNYLYLAGIYSSGLEGKVNVIDVSGAEVSNSRIGSAEISKLSVLDAAYFGSNVVINDGLSVGGGIAFSSTNTTSLSFLGNSYFNSFATDTSSSAFVLNADNFSNTSSGYLLSVRAQNQDMFRVGAGGLVEAGGFNSFGTSTFNGDLNLFGSALFLSGVNYSQYFIDSAGTAGYVWMSDGVGSGSWVATSSLGISGGGGSLPGGSEGSLLIYSGGNWVSSSTPYLNNLYVNSSNNGSLYVSNTSTLTGSVVLGNGLVYSSVSTSGGGGGSNLITDNPGFESSLSTTTPWETMFLGDGLVEVTSSFFNSGSNSAILYSNNGAAVLSYHINSITELASHTLSFYAASGDDNQYVRVALQADNCGVDNRWGYDFVLNDWVCSQLDGLSNAQNLKDISVMAGSFLEKNVNFKTPAAASSTDGLSVIILTGSSDGALELTNNMVAVDDFSLTMDGVGGDPNVGFTLDAFNFSSTSPDILLSLRSGGNQVAAFSAGGDLYIGGVNYSQYFIDSSGTSGSVWVSDGSGRGHWVATSSLGISGGGGSLPSGYLNGVMSYGNSGWEATSSLSLSSLSVSNFGINSSGQMLSGVSSGIAGSENVISDPSFENSSPLWAQTQNGDGVVVVSSELPHTGTYSAILQSSSTGSDFAAIEQTVSNTLNISTNTLAFYAATGEGTNYLRVFILGDSDGYCGGGDTLIYNFSTNAWQCTDFSSPDLSSTTSFIDNILLTSGGSFSQYSIPVAPLASASSSNVTVYFLAGGDSIYTNQGFAVDDVSFSNDGSVSNAFVLDAVNFTSSSVSSTLLSVRSGGVEKLNLSSDGNLTLAGGISALSRFNLNAVAPSSLFNAAGNVNNGESSMPVSLGSKVVVSNGFAYVSDPNDYTITIANVSDPNSPSYVSSVTDVVNDGSFYIGEVSDIAINNETLFVLSNSHQTLSMVDVSVPESPNEIHTFNNGDEGGNIVINSPRSMALSGNYAFVMSNIDSVSSSVQILDVSTTTSSYVASYGSGMDGTDFYDTNYIYLYNNFAYILSSAGNDRLVVLDVSDPNNPSFVTSSYISNPTSAVAKGSYLYVADKDNYQLYIFNIANPYAMQLVGRVNDGDQGGLVKILWLSTLRVDGDLLFAASNEDNQNYIEILNISNPEKPIHYETLINGQDGMVFNQLKDFYVNNSDLYIISSEGFTGDAGLFIADRNGGAKEVGNILDLQISSSSFFSISNTGVVRINTSTTVGDYKLFVDAGSEYNAGIGINGYIKASGFITGSTTLDLAETYPIDPKCSSDNSCPEVGDIVCVGKAEGLAVKKCNFEDREKILGVVSGNPGMILGGSGISANSIFSTSSRALALAGRVPVKVVLTTGTIEMGDELTISTTTGVAQKSIDPGRVVGTALETFGSSTLPYPQTGTVLMFVNAHFSMGSIEPSDISEDFPDFSQTVLDKFTLGVQSSLRKLGILAKEGMVKIKELFADKVHTNVLCVGDTCVTETELRQLLNRNSINSVSIPTTDQSSSYGTGGSSDGGVVSSSSSSNSDTITDGNTTTIINTDENQASGGSQSDSGSSSEDQATVVPPVEDSAPVSVPPVSDSGSDSGSDASSGE